MSVGAVVESVFEYEGFKCVVLMQALGFRTGYVGIPKGHPFYKKDYDELNFIMCHGGLTYSDSKLVCMKDENVWWIGFDTGHFNDGKDYVSALVLFKEHPELIKQILFMKSLDEKFGTFEDFEVRDLEYCENECRSIVKQIKEVNV